MVRPFASQTASSGQQPEDRSGTIGEICQHRVPDGTQGHGVNGQAVQLGQPTGIGEDRAAEGGPVDLAGWSAHLSYDLYAQGITTRAALADIFWLAIGALLIGTGRADDHRTGDV